MKYTRQDIEQYKQWGEENKVIAKLMKQTRFQPYMFTTGYYSAPSWNWGYVFGIVKIGKAYYELMTQFGCIVGGREIYIDTYTMKQINAKIRG